MIDRFTCHGCKIEFEKSESVFETNFLHSQLGRNSNEYSHICSSCMTIIENNWLKKYGLPFPQTTNNRVDEVGKEL